MKARGFKVWSAMSLLAASALLLASGCQLPDNFWAANQAEAVNRSIFAAINLFLAGWSAGEVQI